MKVVGVYVGKVGTTTSDKVDKLQVLPDGIANDRHRGKYKLAGAQESHIVGKGTYVANLRQVTIVSTEELAIIASDLNIPSVLAEDLSANILVEGIPSFTFLPSCFLSFSRNRGKEVSAVLRLMGENRPCVIAGGNLQERYPDEARLASKFVAASLGLRGQVAIVYANGIIRSGDTISLIPHQPKT